MALALPACRSDLGPPGEPGQPAVVTITSGAGQSGPAGRPLARAIVARVTDAEGHRVAGQRVTFSTSTGSGGLTPTAAVTRESGDPDALDSIVPMAFGNLALDLIIKKEFGRLVSVHKGFYDSVPITSVTSEKKVVDVKKYYNTDRLRPIYEFDGAPLFIMTSD